MDVLVTIADDYDRESSFHDLKGYKSKFNRSFFDPFPNPFRVLVLSLCRDGADPQNIIMCNIFLSKSRIALLQIP